MHEVSTGGVLHKKQIAENTFCHYIYSVRLLVACILFILPCMLSAQESLQGSVYTRIDGTYLMSATILPNGDTLIDVTLHEVEIRAPRKFANPDEYKRWERYRYYAPSVVNYAAEAVKTYRQLEVATRNGTSRERKRYIHTLEDQMESKMRVQLKNLTRTQGLLLIKMVERELHMPFYDLVKDVKGGFTAFYWNEFGKIYDYHLKEGYERGKDAIMDSVLDQYDLAIYLQ